MGFVSPSGSVARDGTSTAQRDFESSDFIRQLAFRSHHR
jgi:hypothetical protein